MNWFRSAKKSCNHLKSLYICSVNIRLLPMKDFFYAIQELFEGFLFIPFNALKELELDNWWAANIVSWILAAIGLGFFIYWMLQLRKFDKNNEEDKSITSHSYL